MLCRSLLNGLNAMDTNLKLSNNIKAEALRLGFYACGIAKAEPVNDGTAAEFHNWLASKKHADMAYMANNVDKRLDPRLLVDGVKSIVSVVFNYTPIKRIATEEYQIAAYAYGKDYHEIVKHKLNALVSNLNITNYRVFCDTAPVLERYWAARAGLGWIGKNHQLIVPNAGSMFFLGELFLNVELAYDTQMNGRCGTCQECINACPADVLNENEFDCNKCLSYQTIESRNALSDKALSKMGNRIFGCDECQLCCPHNSFAKPTNAPELQPKQELLQMTKDKWHNLTEEDYRRLFKGSAVKRAKYAGIMRNIKAIEYR